MSDAQAKDAPLTPTGMPTLVVGEITYGLFFPVAGVKAFAEKRGVSFQQMLSDGWRATELSEEELRFLLMEALSGAERRRQVFRPGPARTIDEALIDRIFALHHISDVWEPLLEAWNHGPRTSADAETQEDPQRPAQLPPDGEAFSD